MSILTDVETLAAPTEHPDNKILAAWTAFTDRHWETMNTDDPGDNEAATILDTPAQSLAGVIVKLRMLMFTSTGVSRIEATALGATVPGFEESIRGDDYVTELVWSAIKDLKAMEAGRA
ncbi:hypothetical protein HHL26_06575 [Sphingobium sp. TB-6]|uniref:hypothetical protein n=1 Tax=Sphingobium sp. TB-6 TaxID=2728850 RepID=UPI00146C2828|nr:hypothetical protein [Sphingobium sp. TB-6]NML88731.1 hypothetical protein [Sphingobium sp. TB-6]